MGTLVYYANVVVELIHPYIDRDGTIDLLITTCSSVSQSSGLGSNCALNIAYNTQLPLCASTSSFHLGGDPATAKPCRSPTALCIADAHFSLSFSGPVRSPLNLRPTTPGDHD